MIGKSATNPLRDQLLAAVRRHRVPLESLPTEEFRGIEYEDAAEKFAEVLASVGGSVQRVADATALARAIAQSPAYQQSAARGCALSLPDTSFAPEESMNTAAPAPPVESKRLEWTLSLNDVEDPHEFATLEFAVLPGYLGVAENGAVWVTDHSLRHRVVFFLARHLALVVPAERVVHNLLQAYERIAFGATDNAFGCFISGPSKTADIEQSLVIGAHGPRSLTVYLIDDAASSGLGR